jgi:small subunit ribosomal protein S1
MSAQDDLKIPAPPFFPPASDETADKAVPAPSAKQPAAPEDDFATLFAASESAATGRRNWSAGDLVSGRVIAVGQNSAFVAIGAKGEAELDLAEFRDPQSGAVTIAVGDLIEATVTDDGSKSGSVTLKRTLGRGAHVSEELMQAQANGVPVEGLVSGEVKGGYEVQIGHLRAFCPGSQIDFRRGERRPPDASYIGQRFQFRVTKIESGGRNIVVSRRQLLEEEAAAQAARTWEQITVGAVLQGRVTSVRDFGAFVDIGGVEGLIHVSELGYGRAEHPSEVVQEGQVVEAQVIRVDEVANAAGRRQVALSLKALARDPWETIGERFSVGTTVAGVVRRLEQFGAFVEIAPGIDGLVHVSKIVLDRRIAHPRQVLNIGDQVEVTIVGIDTAKRRISLSMIEKARNAKDAASAAEQAEEKAELAKQNAPAKLGTLADLLSKAGRK